MAGAQRMFQDVMLMTGTGMLMRLISLAFQVYLTRIIGAEGIGLFQLILSAEAFAVTLAVCGMRFAAMRLVSIRSTTGGLADSCAACRRCIHFSAFTGTLAAVVLYLSSDFMADFFLRTLSAAPSLRILSFSLPFLAVSAALGGFFNAVQRVDQNIVIQFLEQAVRIAVTCILLWIFQPRNAGFACALVCLGNVAAEILSCLSLLLLFRRLSRKAPDGKLPARFNHLLLTTALPIAASALLRSGLASIESFLTPRGLRMSGMNRKESLSAYGLVRGMAMTVVMFPAAPLTALAELLVPEITKCQSAGQKKRLSYILYRTFQLTIPLSIGIAGILLGFAGELGNTLYKSQAAGRMIAAIAPLVPVMYIDNLVDSVLKGMGAQVSSMAYNIWDAAAGIFFVLTLLPRFGLEGYLAALYFTEIFNYLLSYRKMKSLTGFRMRFFPWVLAPLLISSGTVSGVLLFQRVLPLPLPLSILLALLSFCLLLPIVGTISREDVLWLRHLSARRE